MTLADWVELAAPLCVDGLEFYSGFLELYNACTNKDRELDLSLTDEQINSYFVEDFKRSGVAQRLLPEKISEPRVLLEPGKIRLAFRYGSGLWSSIITIDFGLWLCPEESNVVALELQGLHAGSLPIGAQAFLDSLSEIAEQNNIQVSWHRYPPTGNPVALLRFQSDARDTSLQLQAVHVEQEESIPDQIADLAKLRDQGVITEAEFQAKKKELLSRM